MICGRDREDRRSDTIVCGDACKQRLKYILEILDGKHQDKHGSLYDWMRRERRSAVTLTP